MTSVPEPSRGAPSVPASVPVALHPPRSDDPALYINRELSWLEFNARVLAEADDSRVPLYERAKFLAIFASNLDEFFMVRVAGLQAQQSGEVEEATADGMTPLRQLTAISERAHELTAESYRIWNEVRPQLKGEGVALVSASELDAKEQAALDEYFAREIYPALTPIAIDPVHPFPHVRNKSINVGMIFEKRPLSHEPSFGLVQVPRMIPRLIRVPLEGSRRAFVAIEELILRHTKLIFPQLRVTGQYAFRVTRNFDLQLDDEEGEDLLRSLQAELRRRERGNAVRLEVSGSAPQESLNWLCRALEIDPTRDVYLVDGPLFLGDMTVLSSGDERRDLRDEAFVPQYVPPLRDSDDFFETIAARDVLLHHPYESFEAVIDFLSQAAEDPRVIAIKQTLYRTGGESPLVRALQRAAELGKQVTALVELKARFDEESNISWARALERSGVNVMYGLLGFKTHAKVLMVVRREREGLKRYVHLATGNYNQQTARLYEDVSMFTARMDIAEDATAFFNMLTGYSSPARWNRLIVSPLGLHEAVLGLIGREAEHARAGRPAGIVAKLNSLVDADVIAALYSASQAGVPIDLLVRGICCLRPGLEGVSDKIRVHTVIDRFLEHARIFHFRNGGADEVFCSSADWMPRNFRRRVEVMFPVLDEGLKQRMIEEILGNMRSDTAKGWLLRANGHYERAPEREGLRSQQRFMELARERAREQEPIRGLASKPLTMPPPPIERLRRRAEKKRKKRRRDES
ncbi:MAG: polyphosphate kinase 1 [Polyangiaceae bacterium]|jgi:polyphosphate kinase|nr:polyphosphate kinase 1 [Polyangiaceae bacterium]